MWDDAGSTEESFGVSQPLGVVYRPLADSTPRAFAQRAEALGFESVWVSEAWGDNAVAVLTEMAHATDSIALGSAIVNVFSRTPALLAMSARSIGRMSNGRVRLGLGTSHPRIIEGLHGVPFEAPLTRLEETVELLSQYLGDRTIEFDGECFDVDAEGYQGLDVDVNIYNAALGLKNRRLTGRLCDGWIPNQLPIADLETYYEAVADGASAAGRDPSAIDVMPWVPAVASSDPSEARTAIGECIAFYVGNYPFYRNAVGKLYPEAAERVARAWADDPAGAAAAVDDELADAMGVYGTPDRARSRFRELTDQSFIDVPILTFPPIADDALVSQTIEELAPAGR